MPSYQFHTKGLTDQQVQESRSRHGFNKTDQKKENSFLIAAKSLLKEPMFLLLLAASTIYFISGKTGDGIFMVSAIVLVAAISFYQESRSRNAIDALRKLTQPFSKVIRNGEETKIPSEEIVIGDYMMVEEGTSIPADGIVIQSNDFSVDESILTGESLAVGKSQEDNTIVYQGTTVMGGLAICRVDSIGSNAQLGKIVFLTLVNRSFYYSVITKATYKNNFVPLIILITMVLTGLLLFVSPLTGFFEFQKLSGFDLLIATGTGFLSVIWFEVVKWRNRRVGF